jgi:hypothetical protein
MNLKEALSNTIWLNHKIGNQYTMDGKPELWKIAYFPLSGTYEGEINNKKWVDFDEPRALIEKPMEKGIDFREVPLRYLNKTQTLF